MALNFQELTKTYDGVSSAKQGEFKGRDPLGQFVEGRFYKMSFAKQAIREVWQGTQDLYYCNDWEWIVKGEGFDRPVRFPTLRDVTKSLVDQFMKDPPDIILHPKDYDNPQAQNLIIGKKAYIDQRRNSIHEKKVRRQVVEDMFMYGKGFRDVEYWDIEKELDGEVTTLFKDVATQRLDPRDVFVDEQATTLHDKLRITGARDIIIRRKPSLSTFLEMAKQHPEWDQEAVKQVKPENFYTTYGLDYLVTTSRETLEKSPNWVVKLYEYQNQELDLYALVAGGVCIYSGSLKKCKGTDTFSVADYTFEPRNDSYWGNNLAQLIAPHIWMKDTVFNLDYMNFKLTAQPVVAVSGSFGYNPAIHFLQPGGVWEAGGLMNGNLADNIQPLIAGNANIKTAETLQRIDSELSLTTHSDERTMMYYPDKTATEVLRQNQMANAHNEQVEAIAEVESEAVVYELFIQVMASFMSAKDADGKYKHIRIDDYAVSKKTGEGPSFEARAGMTDAFALSQEMIDLEAEVEVLDKRTQKSQEIEEMGRIMQAIPMIGNIIQIQPELILPKIDVVGLLGQLVEAVGLDPDRTFVGIDNIYDDFKETSDEIILGHDVDVPTDEDRQESLIRLKFFLNFEKDFKKSGNALTFNQNRALQYHIQSTLANITANHIEKKRQQAEAANPQKQQQQLAEQQGNSKLQGMMGEAASQQADKVQTSNQRKQQISGPDEGLVNQAGAFGQQLQ